MRAQAYATESVRPLRLFEHTIPRQGWVTQLIFSPNSRKLISRAESNERDWGDARLWDLESGELLSLPAGITRATAAAWSADGSLLAIGDEFGRIVVVNAKSLEPVADIHVDGGDVIELEFSPRADRLAIAAGNELSLWSLSDELKCLGRFMHPKRIAGLRYSPTGDHISSLCSDAGARLFRIMSGELAPPQMTRGNTWKTPSWDPAIPLFPRFTNDGKTWIVFPRFLDTVMPGGADSLVLVDVESGKTTDVPLKGGRVVEISPNEQYVFDAYEHGAIRKLADGSSLGSYDHSQLQYAISAAFHPDGSLVLVGSGERIVRMMKVPELTPVMAPIEHAQTVSCVAVAPDGRSFATAEAGALVHVWAFPSGPARLSARFRPLALSQISFADVSRDGRYAVATGRTSTGNELTTTRVVELATGQAVGLPISPGGIILDGRFLSNSDRVAILSAETSSWSDRRSGRSNSGFLHVVDWRSGEPRNAAQFNSEPRSVDIHPTDDELAVLCSDGTVHLLHLDNLKETRTWHAHPPYPDNNWYINNGHLLYSPDGRFLATCGRDNQVRVWDPKTGKMSLAVVHAGQTDEAAFSRSSRYLATSSWNKNEVRVTDVTTGQLVSPFLMHPDWAYSAEFSPDERLLVTSCRDGSARVWNWRTGDLVGRALEHSREVHIAKFLHRGTRVLTVSDDNSARLWETQTGQPLTAPIALGVPCLSIAIDPNEKYAVLGAFNGRMTILPLEQFSATKETDAGEKLSRYAELMSGKRLQAGGDVKLTAAEQLERYKLAREAIPNLFSLDEDQERLFHRYQDACEAALSTGQADRYLWNLRQRLAQRKPAENLRDLADEVELWSSEPTLSPRFAELAALAAAQLTQELLATPESNKTSSLDSNAAVAYSLAGWSGLAPAQADVLHQLARQLADQHPENGGGRITLAFAQYRIGEFQAALESIQASRELGEAGVDNIFVEAMARHRLGEVDRAKALFSMASAWIQEGRMALAGFDSIRLWKEAADVLDVPRLVPTADEAHAVVTPEMITRAYPEKLVSEIDPLRRSSLWAACAYWEQAEAELGKSVPQAIFEPRLWNQRAVAILARDDQTAFRETCQAMRKNFGAVKTQLTFVSQYWIVWTCLLAPGAIDNEARPHTLAKDWDEGNPGDADITLLHGLSLYRRGEYAAALERFTESQRLFDKGQPSIGHPIYVMPLRAMACHRLGQVDEAKSWLSKTNAALDLERAKCLAEDNPSEFHWHRRATIIVLQREAERVLAE